MSRETCETCRFYVQQACRRRAPLIQPSDPLRLLHPLILNPYDHWCGEHEPVKREPVAETEPTLEARIHRAMNEHANKGYGAPNLLYLGQSEYDEAVKLFQQACPDTMSLVAMTKARPIELCGLYIQLSSHPEFLGVGYDAQYGYAPAEPHPPRQ